MALHVVSARVVGGAALRLGARANLELLVGARVGDALLAGRRAQGAARADFFKVQSACVAQKTGGGAR